jgi:hypothetical protein
VVSVKVKEDVDNIMATASLSLLMFIKDICYAEEIVYAMNRLTVVEASG